MSGSCCVLVLFRYLLYHHDISVLLNTVDFFACR